MAFGIFHQGLHRRWAALPSNEIDQFRPVALAAACHDAQRRGQVGHLAFVQGEAAQLLLNLAEELRHVFIIRQQGIAQSVIL